MKYFPPEIIRATLIDLKRQTASSGSESPTWDQILTVSDHEGALDPSRPVVIGDRGTGKSFWTGVLLDQTKRKRLSSIYSRLGLENLEVALGFGGSEFESEHPTNNELVYLLKKGFAAEPIWRAVFLSLLPNHLKPKAFAGEWEDKVRWVSDSPSFRRELFKEADDYFLKRGERFLVAFDALDTMSSTWDEIATLMRGLLQLGLFLRSSRALKIKMFLRPDMAEEPSLWAVGDSSKLRYDEVTLIWTRRDLHALLIQYLANENRTQEIVSEFLARRFQITLRKKNERLELPQMLAQDEKAQEIFFSSIAGEYMGKSATKGRTYTWVPNHLANARGFAAPRSFLLALSVAAEKSRSSATALDLLGIQEGVRQASDSRMRELSEDYRWINAVFRPLRDSIVPMERIELTKRWREENVIALINSEISKDTTGRYLPPPGVSGQKDDPGTHSALIDTLDHLGIVSTMGDGRINMPDLFRLAAGVKRKGGVKLRP